MKPIKLLQIGLLFMLIYRIGLVDAQTFEEYKKQVGQEFETYKAEEWRKFKEYRDKVNAEFAEYMRQAWTKREAEPAIPVPDVPKPPKPVVKDPNRQPVYEPLPFDGMLPAPFVQTAFEYQTDQEQFGVERPLFPDETLYYLYSDCEDRAILYSVLMRELLGLDVVLLHYPNHLATAVYFGEEEVPGDYFALEGRRYVVCDPTYINANIGESMPRYKTAKAKIIRVN